MRLQTTIHLSWPLHRVVCRAQASPWAFCSVVHHQLLSRSGKTSLPRCSCAQTPFAALSSRMPESVVQNLQPQALWDFFLALTQLPRPSKTEEKYVVSHTSSFVESCLNLFCIVVTQPVWLQGDCILARFCNKATFAIQAGCHRQHGDQKAWQWRR